MFGKRNISTTKKVAETREESLRGKKEFLKAHKGIKTTLHELTIGHADLHFFDLGFLNEDGVTNLFFG